MKLLSGKGKRESYADLMADVCVEPIIHGGFNDRAPRLGLFGRRFGRAKADDNSSNKRGEGRDVPWWNAANYRIMRVQSALKRI